MSDAPRPYFVAPGAPHAPGRNRLLLLAYHYPPGEAAGALRWQKLTRYAAERGWGLDVVTRDPDVQASVDESRMAELPPGTRVYGAHTPRPLPLRAEDALHRLYRRFRPKLNPAQAAAGAATAASGARKELPVPGHETVPQGQIRFRPTRPRDYYRVHRAVMHFLNEHGWAMEAAGIALRVFDPARHAAVITSGPPHFSHEGGRTVSVKAGIPFVMDMRDTWSLFERMPEDLATPIQLSLARRYERKCVERASLVVMNTELARIAMATQYPEMADKLITVMNGYDEEGMPRSRPSDRFTIAYAGNIYLNRDPRLVMRAAATIVREEGLSPDRLALEFMGNVSSFGGVPLEEMGRQEGLPDGFVHVHPPRPRKAAMDFLAGATMLVNLPQDAHMAIPSKIFEYVQFDAWLLALDDTGSATEMLLRDSGADVVAPDDLERITAVLRERYRQFARGERPTRIAANGRFRRREQAGIFFDAMERAIADR